MAFGKNPAGLNNVGSFRQASHTFNQHRNERKFKKKNGGGPPSWVNEYRPSTDDVDVIRVLQGSYVVDDVDAASGELVKVNLTFWPFVEHFDARSKRRSVCSGGPHHNDRNNRQPCYGCDLFWSSMKTNPVTGKREKGFMGKRDMAAFTVFDYSKYHKVEQIDRQTGQVRTNDAGQPFYNWVKCSKSSEGRGVCDACDAGKETKQGHRLHWPMGSDHYNTLLSYDEAVGRACVVCGQKDVIRNDAWLCSNQECGEAIIDDRTRLTKKEIDAVVYKPCKCKVCGTEGFLTELIHCMNCTPAGRTPKRATIFDVDLKVQRVEDASNSNRTTLSIVGFSEPKPIAKQFAEMAKPEDLTRIYAPTPLAKQAALFQVPHNATAEAPPQREPVNASNASRPYGKTDDGNPPY